MPACVAFLKHIFVAIFHAEHALVRRYTGESKHTDRFGILGSTEAKTWRVARLAASVSIPDEILPSQYGHVSVGLCVQ